MELLFWPLHQAAFTVFLSFEIRLHCASHHPKSWAAGINTNNQTPAESHRLGLKGHLAMITATAEMRLSICSSAGRSLPCVC